MLLQTINLAGMVVWSNTRLVYYAHEAALHPADAYKGMLLTSDAAPAGVGANGTVMAGALQYKQYYELYVRGTLVNLQDVYSLLLYGNSSATSEDEPDNDADGRLSNAYYASPVATTGKPINASMTTPPGCVHACSSQSMNRACMFL